MSAAFDRLLSALSHVRAGRNETWTARCPAHDDRSPSLSIRAVPDGRILLHCFAGCSAAEVVSAAGLTLADLMPPRPRDTGDGPGGYGPQPVAWRAQMATVQREAMIIVLAFEALRQGRELSPEDGDRVHEAMLRLRAFAEMPS